MANPNDATFHARITADARDFIDQTLAASEALSALIAQSSKAGGPSGAANAGKSGESEAKRLGAAMRAEQEKTSAVVKQNIQEENQLRAEGLRAINAQNKPFVTQPKNISQMPGPVREGALGSFDERRLVQQYRAVTGAVDGYTKSLTDAERVARKLAEIKVRPAGPRSTLEGPVRNQADAAKLITDMKAIRREREMEATHYKALIMNSAFAARENRKQMDAMVTGRYALYDLAEAYDVVGRAGMRFLGFFKQAIQTTAEFETAFTSVEGAIRPLPGEVEALKQSLIDLTREIPLSFTQIAEIATLGAQMGVASADINDFTKTVASFSAITGSSINETAEAFGRISCLADVPVSEYENLASAITYAGVNAVATEEQILTLTQSIAASSRQAGFSADEIVGLATAVSSLGVQPEQARGVFIRVFGDIGREIDIAGDKLEVFSNISGMSAEDIKASWGTDPKKFFGAFLEGLSRVENKTAAFDAAGFVDTREINVLQKLIGSLDVYNGSMEDAIKAYADGTYLGERYSITVDNIASKITILQSNIKAFADGVGSAVEGPLKGLIDGLSFVLVAITKFSQNPVGAFVVAFTAVTVTLVTVISLLAAASFRATAQLFAMRTAMIQMDRSGQSLSGGLMNLIQTMLGQVRMLELADKTTVFYTKKQAIAKGVLQEWTAAAGTATIATRGLTTALRILGIASGVLAVISIAGIAAEMLGISAQAAKLEGLDFNGIADAVKEDTAAMKRGEKVYGTFVVNVEKSKDELKKTADAHEKVATAAGKAEDAIDDNTMAFGENTEAAIKNAFVNSEAFKKNFESLAAAGQDITKILEENGGSLEEMIQASLKDPGEGAINYLKTLIPGMADNIAAAQSQVVGGATDMVDSLLAASNNPAIRNIGVGLQAGKELSDVAVEIDRVSGEAKSGANWMALWGVAGVDAAGNVQDALEDVDVDPITQKIRDSFNELNKEITLQDAIETLGKSLKKNGDDFDKYSKGGRENLQALQAVLEAYAASFEGDAQGLANNLATFMTALTALGINSAAALDLVKTAIESTGTVSQEVLDEALSRLKLGLTDVGDSAGTAQTALEKLQGAIEKTFAKMDRRLAFQDSLSSLRDSLLENGSNFSRFSESGRANIGAVRDMIDSLAERSNGNSRVFSSSLNAMKKAMVQAGLGGTKAVSMINKAIKASGSNAKASAAQVRQFANALKLIDAGNVIAAANAINNLADSVMNYLNARWMLGNTQMEIAAGWEEIANNASDAREEIEDISDEIAGFAADRSILEYQLGIAIKYGDELRANQLRAEIEELNNREQELIDENRRQQQEAAGGATPAADLLAQQQALQQMVGYYVQLGAAEVISAKNKKQAKEAINETVNAFKDQAREAGVSEENIKKYAKELRTGLKLARELNKPAEYKINARTQNALNEIRRFRDEANAAINSIKTNVTVTVTTVQAKAGGGIVYASGGGKVSGAGTGTSDSIPAMLSNGEFVMRAAAVKAYGTDFMNSINQIQAGRSLSSTSVGSSAAGGSSVVYLSPEDRNLLRQAIDRPINLYSDATKIAQSANQGNVILAQRGTK